jgi:DNA-binding IscR family transcriptional regulator
MSSEELYAQRTLLRRAAEHVATLRTVDSRQLAAHLGQPVAVAVELLADLERHSLVTSAYGTTAQRTVRMSTVPPTIPRPRAPRRAA